MTSASAMFLDSWLDNVRAGTCRRHNRKAFKGIQAAGLEDAVVAKVDEIKDAIQSRADVVTWSAKFNWTSDPNKGASDWSPDIFKIAWDLVAHGEVRDDCDGAARFTNYLFKYLSENSGTWHRVHEFSIIPRPITKGIPKSHVILVEYKRSAGDLDNVVVWSNGHIVKNISTLKAYAEMFIGGKGFSGYELRMIPPSNMDGYLADRFVGPA